MNDGLQDAASANTMKVNIGDAVEVNVKSWNQATNGDGNTVYPPVVSQTITLKDDTSTTVTDGAPFQTNETGVMDLSGVPDGNYTGSYIFSKDTPAEYAVTEQTLTMADVQLMINYIVGKATPNANEIVSGNLNEDTSLNMVDVQLAINTLVGKVDGKVILRDAASTDAVYDQGSSSITNNSNVFAIQAGNAMDLEAFYLGDVNGSYATQIVS